VVRLLRLGKLRDVSPEEIHRAAERFAREQLSNPKAHSYVRAASYFAYVAKKWLRFLGRLKPLSVRRARFADQLDGFAQIHGIGTGTVAAIYPVKLLEEEPSRSIRFSAASLAARKIVWLGSSEGEVAAMSLRLINPEEILLADTAF
jgi:hypothetical protein